MVPVVDELSGETIAALGIDLDIKNWNGIILEKTLPMIILSVLLLLISVIGLALTWWKKALPPERRKRRFSRYLDAITVFFVSLTITFMAAFSVNENQKNSRNETFESLAVSKATFVSQAIRDMLAYELESLSLFFESSERVERREFETFVSPILSRGDMTIWGWAPAVTSGERSEFESRISTELSGSFEIWEMDDQGKRVGAGEKDLYYPIVYLEPLVDYREFLGLDLDSNAITKAVIEETVETGFITASDPTTLLESTGEVKGVLILNPSYKEVYGTFHGFVLTFFRPEVFMKLIESISLKDETTMMGIYILDNEGRPVFLASTVGEHDRIDNSVSELRHYHEKELNVVMPIFEFGKVFMIVVHPSLDYEMLYPLQEGWMTLVIGAIVSMFLTVVVGSLNNHSYRLQREVQQRTEALRTSLDKLTRTMEGSVRALASAVDLRDPYTSGHQRRVTALAVAIAEKMGIDSETINGLRLAASVHDVGKIQVPAEILSSPRRLSTLEYEMIKMHPGAGHSLFEGIEFPWPVAEIIYQHHERLDGSGYPRGLSGDEIMLEARIIAVADVMEAMTSHRPYRPAPGLVEALKEIRDNSGRLYDPAVVSAIIELIEEGYTF
jgi:HD-GYP domain-containing protein (c-di-GMP phosphodiesterase class II)